MHEHPPSPRIKSYLAPYSNGTLAATSYSVLAVRGRIFRLRHGHTLGTGHDCPVRVTAVSAYMFGILL